MFGSGIFFAAALIIGGFGFWADSQLNFYYDEGIPAVGKVVGSRTVTGSGASSGRVTRLYDLRVRHPEFGPVSLELAKPAKPAPLPGGAPASDARVLVLLHPTDPAAGRIASAEGPLSPVWVTSIMALVFILVATLNLFSERRLIGSRRSRMRRD